MARLLVALFLILVATVVFAEEQTSEPKDNETITLAPSKGMDESIDQKQKAERNWFCVIIQKNYCIGLDNCKIQKGKETK